MVAPTSGPGRARRLVVGVVALVLLAGGCTDDGGTEDAAATSSTIPPAQTVLRVGVEEWPECLNPVTCASPVLHEQVLQHVLPVTHELDPDGEYRPSPLLAEEADVEVAEEGTMTVTYRLHPDARWNDGRPITSSDLRGTWQAVLATPGADTDGFDLITAVDDADPLVAVATFSEPYAQWRELFGGSAGWVLQADAFGADLDLTGRFQDELPFSAAPYRLADWDGDTAVLAAVEDHWEEERRPEIDQVRLALVDIDELDNPRAFDLLVPDSRAAAAPAGFDRRHLPTTTMVGLWFDRRTALLDPVNHRSALAAALDRTELADLLVDDPPEDPIACLGWLPSSGPWCEIAETELPPHEPPVARFGLGLEGWGPTPDGTLARGFELFTVPLSHDPDVRGTGAVADAVAESLSDVGVTVDRVEVDTRAWAGRRAAAEPTGIGVFAVDLPVSGQAAGFYGCPDGPPTSPMAWCPPAVVEAARTLTTTVDTDDQEALVARIGAAAGEQVAWLPIAQLIEVSFVQSGRVEVPGSVPVTAGPLGRLWDFTMDD